MQQQQFRPNTNAGGQNPYYVPQNSSVNPNDLSLIQKYFKKCVCFYLAFLKDMVLLNESIILSDILQYCNYCALSFGIPELQVFDINSNRKIIDLDFFVKTKQS